MIAAGGGGVWRGEGGEEGVLFFHTFQAYVIGKHGSEFLQGVCSLLWIVDLESAPSETGIFLAIIN